MRNLWIACGLVLLFFTTVYAGDPVYFDGGTTDMFSSQAVTEGEISTSGAHRVDHDTIYGIHVKCSGTFTGIGLAYQISPTSTSTDFMYPAGISWVIDSLTDTDAHLIAFEPEVKMDNSEKEGKGSRKPYEPPKLFNLGGGVAHAQPVRCRPGGSPAAGACRDGGSATGGPCTVGNTAGDACRGGTTAAGGVCRTGTTAAGGRCRTGGTPAAANRCRAGGAAVFVCRTGGSAGGRCRAGTTPG